MLPILLLVGLQSAAIPSDARQVALSAPQAIADVDVSRTKGDVSRLAWSPDGSEFYVQAIERDRHGVVKSTKHYLVSLSSKSMKAIDAEPAWASKYWSWKADRASPAAPAFNIAADNHQETVRSTASPVGGAMAKGGTANPTDGSSLADVAAAADQTQRKNIWTLEVKGQTIGEWVNEPVTPGVNFTWAPAPLRMIAFAKREGGPLIVVDDAGRRQELTGSTAAFLPAWSDDGRRIAWLERRDKKKYQLTIADVTAR